MDWHKTPQSFTYKLMEGDKPGTLTTKDASEVGITGYVRFIRATVKIDRSNDNVNAIDELSLTREPKWSDEELFLKVVVDGPSASLYAYYEEGFSRFLYSLGNAPVEQLIYKPYRTTENFYNYNMDYINQLNANLNCSLPDQRRNQPKYTENDLRKYFMLFNGCKGAPAPVSNTSKQEKTKRFSVSILSGLEYTTLHAQFTQVPSVTHFDSKIAPLIGAEFEFTMPFNKNKVTFLLDIHNGHYNSNGKDSFGVAQISYSAIETAIGPRYRLFVNDKLSFFLNALLVLDFKTSSSYQWEPTISNYYSGAYSEDIKTYTPELAFGAGGSYRNFSAEFRYISPKEIFPQDEAFVSNFDRVVLIVKYRIFKF